MPNSVFTESPPVSLSGVTDPTALATNVNAIVGSSAPNAGQQDILSAIANGSTWGYLYSTGSMTIPFYFTNPTTGNIPASAQIRGMQVVGNCEAGFGTTALPIGYVITVSLIGFASPYNRIVGSSQVSASGNIYGFSLNASVPTTTSTTATPSGGKDTNGNNTLTTSVIDPTTLLPLPSASLVTSRGWPEWFNGTSSPLNGLSGGYHSHTSLMTNTDVSASIQIGTSTSPVPTQGFNMYSPLNLVWTYNAAPTAGTVTINGSSGSVVLGTLTPTLNWTYSDPDGDPQYGFVVIVWNSGQNSTQGTSAATSSQPVWTSGLVNSTANTYAIPGGVLQAGGSYTIEVLVTDTGSNYRYNTYNTATINVTTAVNPLLNPGFLPQLTLGGGVQPSYAFNTSTGLVTLPVKPRANLFSSTDASFQNSSGTNITVGTTINATGSAVAPGENLTVTSTANAGWKSNIYGALAGDLYTGFLTIQAPVVSTPRTLNLSLRFFNSAGTLIGSASRTNNAANPILPGKLVGGSRCWVQSWAPAGTTSVQLELDIPDAVAADVLNITRCAISNGTLNLLNNGDFEIGSSFWTPGLGTSTAPAVVAGTSNVDGDESLAMGTQVAQLALSGGDTYNTYLGTEALDAHGSTFVFSGDVRSTSASPVACLDLLTQSLSAADSDFETGIGGWTAKTNCTVAQSTTQAHSGTHSLALTATAVGAMSAQTALVSVPVTSLVVFSVWMRANTAAQSVAVQIITQAGTSLALTGAPAESTSAFVQYECTAIVPGGTSIRGVAGVSNAGTGEIHFVDTALLFVGAAQSAATTTSWQRFVKTFTETGLGTYGYTVPAIWNATVPSTIQYDNLSIEPIWPLTNLNVQAGTNGQALPAVLALGAASNTLGWFSETTGATWDAAHLYLANTVSMKVPNGSQASQLFTVAGYTSLAVQFPYFQVTGTTVLTVSFYDSSGHVMWQTQNNAFTTGFTFTGAATNSFTLSAVQNIPVPTGAAFAKISFTATISPSWMGPITVTPTGTLTNSPYLNGGWSEGTSDGSPGVVLQRSADNGVTWTTLRQGANSVLTAVPFLVATGQSTFTAPQVVTYTDYEYTPLAGDQVDTISTRPIYRSQLLLTAATLANNSPYGPSRSFYRNTFTDWWLIDLLNPSDSINIQVKSAKFSVTENLAKFNGLGRKRVVVLGDVVQGDVINLELFSFSSVDYVAYMKQLKKQTALLMRSPDGEQWYVRPTKRDRARTWTGSYARQLRTHTIELQEVDPLL